MFNSVRVLCIGDVMLDTFVYGKAHRLSPEAPVPVLNYTHDRHMWGAANVALNAASLGAQVSLLGVIGDDDTGHTMQVLTPSHVEATWIVDPTRPTTHKKRLIADGKHMLRVDREVSNPISEDMTNQIVHAVHNLFQKHSFNIILVSDYAKGVVSKELCQALNSLNVPIFIDPKGRSFEPYQGATLISPNIKELEAATPEGSTENRIQYVFNTTNIPRILLTEGARGMTLWSRSEPPIFVPANAREVFDVSGAGDTCIATFAVACGSGMSWSDAVDLASRAAGIAVSKLGTSIVEIEELFGLNPLVGNLDSLLENWRAEGHIIGFTNGCFDCLHIGHLQSIRQAKNTCHKLVVGLNSDASVRKLKGEDRPLQSQEVRKAVLEALPEVDAVIIFNEDTPYEVIKHIEPDVLIKGGDYDPDQIVGAHIVRAKGGRVITVPLVEGHSTTSMINKSQSLASKADTLKS